jgi:hypothetical protein
VFILLSLLKNIFAKYIIIIPVFWFILLQLALLPIKSQSFLFLFFFFFFCYLGFVLKGFAFSRQELYPLATLPAFFVPVILDIGSHFLPRTAWNVILLFHTSHYSWDERHRPIFFLLGWVSQTFLPRLPGATILLISALCSLECATMPSYWLEEAGGILRNIFAQAGMEPRSPKYLGLQT